MGTYIIIFPYLPQIKTSQVSLKRPSPLIMPPVEGILVYYIVRICLDLAISIDIFLGTIIIVPREFQD
jgi:hypothetical protein